MKKRVFYGAALLAFVSQSMVAQTDTDTVETLEEVVLSDSKFELTRAQSGKVIAKITAEELEKSKGQSVATVLSRVAGITINGRNSSAGQNLGYTIRGGRNNGVVIRVDGVTLVVPSSVGGDFDLRLVSVDQIESIEVLKGAASTLYGSGATTAVINIMTKKASNKPITAQFSSAMGTNQSQEDQAYTIEEFHHHARIHGTLGKLSYATSLSHQFTDGLSAAEVAGATSDPFSRYNVTAQLGYAFSNNFRVALHGNLDDYTTALDPSGADGNNGFDRRQLRAGSFWEYTYPNGSITFVDNYSLFDTKFESDFFASKNDSRLYTFDAYTKYVFSNKIHAVVGANGTYSDFNSFSAGSRDGVFTQTINDHEADFDIIDPYANVVYTSDIGLNLNVGARLNIHSVYGTHFIYSVNPSYVYDVENYTLKGLVSYSTAYTTPTLFELFAPTFGNRDLQPEESSTFEAGIEVTRQKNTRLSVVYFDRRSENFLTFDPSTFVSVNAANDVEVNGIEATFAMQLIDAIDLKANYTYTNIDRLEDAIRIPAHMFNASVGYQLSKATYASIEYQFNDTIEDRSFDPVTFAPTPVALDSYGLLNAHISHQALKNLQVFAAIQNITNTDYQEVFGFSTRGRNVSAGFTLDF